MQKYHHVFTHAWSQLMALIGSQYLLAKELWQLIGKYGLLE